MIHHKKETIRKGYSPDTPQLQNKDAPKGRKVTSSVKPKGERKERPK